MNLLADGQAHHVSEFALALKKSHRVPFRIVSEWLNRNAADGVIVRASVGMYRQKSGA